MITPMDLVSFLTEIYEVVKQQQDYLELLKDKKLELLLTILETIGDVHFSAAKRAFDEAKSSTLPEREFGMAITSLRTAHEAFITAANKKGFLGLSEPGATEKSELFEKATQSALLCAVAYHALKEPALARHHASLARDAFEQYSKACVDRITDKFITLSLINAITYRLFILPGQQRAVREDVDRERQLLQKSLNEIM